MDRELHSRIERVTQDARRLLEGEFAELLYATYDIDRNSGRTLTWIPDVRRQNKWDTFCVFVTEVLAHH